MVNYFSCPTKERKSMKTVKENVIEVFDNIASKGSWEELYSGHIDRVTYNFISRQRTVEQLLEPVINGQVLDVGCGTGDLAPFVIRKNAAYTGVDLSAKMIERAIINYDTIIKSGKATFQIADCEYLPFPSKKFDIVTAVALLEYLPDPIQFLHEVQKVIRPGGDFLLTVPYKNCINLKIKKLLSPLIKTLFPIYARLKVRPLLPTKNLQHFTYSEKELDETVAICDFQRVSYCYSNFHIIIHPFDHLLPGLYMRTSERIDRKGLGESYKRWASNYIALFRKGTQTNE